MAAGNSRVRYGSGHSTREMPVLPDCRRGHDHVCISSPRGTGHCGHCDTDFICPSCKHNGMKTKNSEPPNFILQCPRCKHEERIHWIEFDIQCPRCGCKNASGTYSRLLEPIIQCPNCGPSRRDAGRVEKEGE